jgi:hypothetical protein
MPYYDPTINTTMQMFVSTFVLEHLTKTLLDEAPFDYLIPWSGLIPPILEKPFYLTTSVAEAFWPFLTREFGENIPVDALVRIQKVYNWTADLQNQSLSFMVDVLCEGYLHVPDGSRKLVGTAEFKEGTIVLAMNIKDMNASGYINGSMPGNTTNFKSAWITTTYDV